MSVKVSTSGGPVGEIGAGIGVIELDRPERRNALNAVTCEAIVAGTAELRAAGVRAVVITGAGSSFCSGADLGEVYGTGLRDALQAALRAVHTLPVPVIAAVNGPAIGAGLQLALAADLRIAAPGAVFAIPTARLGLAVDPWTIRRLAQVAGGGTARQLLLACEPVSAELAYTRGLANRLGERADAEALAAELATLAPLTLAYSKLVLDRLPFDSDRAGTGEADLTAALDRVWSSADAVEGRTARQERRSPVYRGN